MNVGVVAGTIATSAVASFASVNATASPAVAVDDDGDIAPLLTAESAPASSAPPNNHAASLATAVDDDGDVTLLVATAPAPSFSSPLESPVASLATSVDDDGDVAPFLGAGATPASSASRRSIRLSRNVRAQPHIAGSSSFSSSAVDEDDNPDRRPTYFQNTRSAYLSDERIQMTAEEVVDLWAPTKKQARRGVKVVKFGRQRMDMPFPPRFISEPLFEKVGGGTRALYHCKIPSCTSTKTWMSIGDAIPHLATHCAHYPYKCEDCEAEGLEERFRREDILEQHYTKRH